MDVIEVNTISRCERARKIIDIIKSNHNFYSILKPTIFCLRFFGAPTGLWRQGCKASVKGQLITKIAAIFMLVLINCGALIDLYSTLRSAANPDRQFDDNMYLFYALGLNVTGALALNILWWRRRILRQLLESIDFEPKICERFDQGCQKANSKEITQRTIKMFIFMLVFAGFTIYSLYDSTSKSNVAWTNITFHINNLLFAIRCLSVIVFALVLSFYISVSWIFRLKVLRINKFLKKVLIEEAKNGLIPSQIHAKVIEVWFISYATQFKKFELIFKQIAGLFFLIQVWSILALAKECITTVLSNQVLLSHEDRNLGHELMSCALLAHFLYSISIVEHYMIKLVKQLYHLSLAVRFISSDVTCIALSKKFKLLGDTIDKTGLSLSVFGLLHINRHLIVSTASFLTTYTILMYELTSDRHRPLLIH